MTLIINLTIGFVVFLTIAYILDILKEKLNISSGNVPHDQRRNSFYQIAQQVRRDEVKRRGY